MNSSSLEEISSVGWDECDESVTALPTSYSCPRNSSITEFDRQKHLNACQLLLGELTKLTEGVKDETEKAVHKEKFILAHLFNDLV